MPSDTNTTIANENSDSESPIIRFVENGGCALYIMWLQSQILELLKSTLPENCRTNKRKQYSENDQKMVDQYTQAKTKLNVLIENFYGSKKSLESLEEDIKRHDEVLKYISEAWVKVKTCASIGSWGEYNWRLLELQQAHESCSKNILDANQKIQCELEDTIMISTNDAPTDLKEAITHFNEIVSVVREIRGQWSSMISLASDLVRAIQETYSNSQQVQNTTHLTTLVTKWYVELNKPHAISEGRYLSKDWNHALLNEVNELIRLKNVNDPSSLVSQCEKVIVLIYDIKHSELKVLMSDHGLWVYKQWVEKVKNALDEGSVNYNNMLIANGKVGLVNRFYQSDTIHTNQCESTSINLNIENWLEDLMQWWSQKDQCFNAEIDIVAGIKKNFCDVHEALKICEEVKSLSFITEEKRNVLLAKLLEINMTLLSLVSMNMEEKMNQKITDSVSTFEKIISEVIEAFDKPNTLSELTQNFQTTDLLFEKATEAVTAIRLYFSETNGRKFTNRWDAASISIKKLSDQLDVCKKSLVFLDKDLFDALTQLIYLQKNCSASISGYDLPNQCAKVEALMHYLKMQSLVMGNNFLWCETTMDYLEIQLLKTLNHKLSKPSHDDNTRLEQLKKKHVEIHKNHTFFIVTRKLIEIVDWFGKQCTYFAMELDWTSRANTIFTMLKASSRIDSLSQMQPQKSHILLLELFQIYGVLKEWLTKESEALANRVDTFRAVLVKVTVAIVDKEADYPNYCIKQLPEIMQILPIILNKDESTQEYFAALENLKHGLVKWELQTILADNSGPPDASIQWISNLFSELKTCLVSTKPNEQQAALLAKKEKIVALLSSSPFPKIKDAFNAQKSNHNFFQYVSGQDKVFTGNKLQVELYANQSNAVHFSK